ncbi:MAG: Serine/threonine protein kinase/WD40 repeat/WD40 repeat [Verrucomicrobia bacterium]|nr:MAG: Serine/threonine protein kinase/WD40 repeat/WD40 repeat [Verrucomicrobiota bacterium]
MRQWSLTLHDPTGILTQFESGEAQFVVGSEAAGDVLRVVAEGVAPRHVRVRLASERMQVEDLGTDLGTLVNGNAIEGRVEFEYPASVQFGKVTLVVEAKMEKAQEAPDPSLAETIPQRGVRQSATSLDVTKPQRPRREMETRRSGNPVAAPSENEAPLAGKYTLVREIARGGMGQIFLAEDPQLKRQVAVKVSSLSYGGEDPRFSKEAAVLAHLAHPNIVPIYNLGVDAQRRPFYSMKLVKGRTLQAVLDAIRDGDAVVAREYPRAALLTVFRKVCDAMAFAHSKGVLHRDLKPENIMVGEYGEVLVMDWGLAKVLGEADLKGVARSVASDTRDSGMTMEGEVMGTPQYMSPEQAEGMVAELDVRSDIYSLGGILYAILTLRPPIDGTTLNEVLTKVRKGEISSMLSKRRGSGSLGEATPAVMDEEVPEALRGVTLKAMARERSKRYARAEEFAADLEAYQNGFATTALQVGAFGHLILLMKRNRGITISIATALCAIFALSSWFVLSLRTKERVATRAAEVAEIEKDKAVQAERQAQASFAKAQIALAEASFRSGDFPEMSKALHLCPEEMRDQTWEYLASKSDSSMGVLKFSELDKPTLVRAVPGEAGQFALATLGGDIGFVQAGTGKLLRKFKTAKGLSNFVFSGDGRLFAVLIGGKELRIYNTKTGEPQGSMTLPEAPLTLSVGQAEPLALNENGTVLAAIVTTSDAKPVRRLQLIDVPSCLVRWYFDSPGLNAVQFHPDGTRLHVIAGGASRYSWIFDAASGKKLSESRVFALCQALHPDGKSVAVGTQEGEVLIIDTASGAVLRNAKLHSGRLISLAWTADGHLLTVGTEGKHYDTRWLFKLWAPRTFALRAVFAGLEPKEPVQWGYDPLSGYLVTLENPCRLWRIPAGRELARLKNGSETGYSGDFLSETILLGRQGWGLTLYELGQQMQLSKIKNIPDWKERFCAVHQKSGLFAISGVEAPIQIRLLSLDAGAVKTHFSKPIPSALSDLCFNDQGNTLAATLTGGSIQTLAVPSGELRLQMPGKFQKAIFAGPGDQLIASQANLEKRDFVEYLVQQLDGTTGAILKSVSVRFKVQALARSPDHSLFAVAGVDRSIYFFNPETLEAQGAFRAHDDEIGALAFHPSLPILASASSDGSVKLWNYKNKKLLDHFIGLAGAPVALAFSPKGNLLLAEAQEDTTRLYDVSHLSAAKSPE